MEPRRILVRATNWVGDAVMSLPALQALRRACPQAHIAILARPWVADLYGREPFCDELIPYDAPKGWRGLGRKWKLAGKLRAGNYDCALLLQNAFEAAAVVWAARIPVRIGYNRDARRLLMTNPIAAPKSGEIPRHQRFYYLELLRRAGFIDHYSADEPVHLDSAATAREAGRQRYRAVGINRSVLAVAPGAAYGGAKRWLPERFAAAAVKIAKERSLSVAIFGSENEIEICNTVAKEIESCGAAAINFSGRTTLRELIDMLAASELLITNDSGPMHLASALGVPTVAVFGATDHIATGPIGNHTSVVRVPVECSPCLLRECPIDHRCMTSVSADQVANEALALTAHVR